MRKKTVVIALLLAAIMLLGGCGIIEGQNYTLYRYIDTVYSLAPQKIIDGYSAIAVSQAPMSVATIMVPCVYELSCTINYSYTAYFTGSLPGTGTIQKTKGSVSRTATAFMINEFGYLITNAHVVTLENEAQYRDLKYESWEIKINLAETDTVFSAALIAYDTDADLAVLRIDTEKVNPSTLAYAIFYNHQDPLTHPNLTVTIYYGEPIIAVGNSCGYGIAVTQGIISAPRRYFSDGLVVSAAIQIDAAVNSGNSGGPLCNVYARVVGMTTSELSKEGTDNVGFAIPTYTILAYLDELNSGKNQGVMVEANPRVKYYYTNLREYAKTNIYSNFSQ